jgi:hypothetical protein
MIRIARATLATLALVGIVALGACGSAKQSSPQTTPSETPSSPVAGMPIQPHFEEQANGRALASGWLRHIDLEGGYWALTAQPPYAMSSAQTIIAVLLPGAVGEADIAKHTDAYLIAEGALSADVSIRNSGPEIRVDSIRLLGMGQ